MSKKISTFICVFFFCIGASYLTYSQVSLYYSQTVTSQTGSPDGDGFSARIEITVGFENASKLVKRSRVISIEQFYYQGQQYPASIVPVGELEKFKTLYHSSDPLVDISIYNGSTLLLQKQMGAPMVLPWSSILNTAEGSATWAKRDEIWKSGQIRLVIGKAMGMRSSDVSWLQKYFKSQSSSSETQSLQSTNNEIYKSSEKTTASYSSNQSNSKDDFWETGKKTNQSSSSDIAGNSALNTQQQDEQARKNKALADQKVVDDFFADRKKDQQRSEQQQRELQQKFTMQSNAFSADRSLNNAKSELQENTKMGRGYSSQQEIMAEFNQKMANINRAAAEMAQYRREAVNAQVNVSTMNGDAQTQAYGELLKVAGAFASGIAEEKARKEALQQLKAEKDAALREMAEEKKRMLTSLRNQLFKRFQEGTFPLSTTKIDANTIYYFVYAIDPQQVSADRPQLYVSNVFPIARYSDGSWPFKSSINNEINALTSLTETMHGYYTSQQEAESMRTTFMNVFTQSGGSIQSITYKGKPGNGVLQGNNSNNGDFWETGKKITDTTNRKKSASSNFWEN